VILVIDVIGWLEQYTRRRLVAKTVSKVGAINDFTPTFKSEGAVYQ
jgi:hypothetical protein